MDNSSVSHIDRIMKQQSTTIDPVSTLMLKKLSIHTLALATAVNVANHWRALN